MREPAPLTDSPTSEGERQRAPERVRRVCIAVDDFGLHDGVDTAVMTLAAQGRIQAAGCMVGGISFQRSAPALFGLDPERIDIGLHLDFTETPLRQPRYASLARLIVASHAHRLDRRALRDEIDAQLDAFENAAGRPPAYVDGHQHVHQFPQIRDELVAALSQRYAGSNRPWLRSTRPPSGLVGCGALDPAARLKPQVIAWLGSAPFRQLATSAGFAQNARLLGVYDFAPDPVRYARLLRAWLSLAREGDLLMCHPARHTSTADPLLPARESEMSVLSGDGLPEMIERAGLSLASIGRILKTRPDQVSTAA